MAFPGRHLPLVPLRGIVVFPGTFLPMEFLPASGRELVLRCLAENHRVVLVLEERLPGSPDGGPPGIPRVGTESRAVHLENPDGRRNIVLQGLGRVLLREEVAPSLPFRLARVRPLTDFGHADVGEADLLRRCIHRLVFMGGPHAGALAHLAAIPGSPEYLADMVTAALPVACWTKQRVLEAADRRMRVRLAVGIVTEFLGRMVPPLEDYRNN